MENKALPVGIDDFKKLIMEHYYYVDKTNFIKELLDLKGEVNLFTRPRRFGKTLNLSMLRYYFENTGDESVNDSSRSLFDGLNIMNAGEKYTSKMCAFPVISLSLKGAKQPDFSLAMVSLKRQIANEFRRHESILGRLGDLSQRYIRIMREEAEQGDYIDAIAFLSQCLYKAYGTKCIILIDEYDVPLENAYFSEFYKEMAGFIRSFFESALKSNPNLEFAVITGCLRISKESIFTGLNNLEIISVLSESYAEHFGFTQTEVREMLAFYGIEDKLEEVKEWYDGYRFGQTEAYNPWSVINYVKMAVNSTVVLPKPYWSNTSSNSIVRELVERADASVRSEIEELTAGHAIEKPVHEDITYEDVYKSQDNLWNFLLFTGYLKILSQRMEGAIIYAKLAIPNTEVKYIYDTTIMAWLDTKLRHKDNSRLYQAILNEDAETAGDILSDELFDTISYYDGKSEAFYHGFMAGLLQGLEDYTVESNREAGNGRPDMILRYKRIRGTAVVMEFKVAREAAEIKSKLEEAASQIETRKYKEALEREGYQRVICYAMVFYRKECIMKMK